MSPHTCQGCECPLGPDEVEEGEELSRGEWFCASCAEDECYAAQREASLRYADIPAEGRR